MPEALWIFETRDFGPLTVAIDSHGNNLFEDVRKTTEENREAIYQKLGIHK